MLAPNTLPNRPNINEIHIAIALPDLREKKILFISEKLFFFKIEFTLRLLGIFQRKMH